MEKKASPLESKSQNLNWVCGFSPLAAGDFTISEFRGHASCLAFQRHATPPAWLCFAFASVGLGSFLAAEKTKPTCRFHISLVFGPLLLGRHPAEKKPTSHRINQNFTHQLYFPAVEPQKYEPVFLFFFFVSSSSLFSQQQSEQPYKNFPLRLFLYCFDQKL